MVRDKNKIYGEVNASETVLVSTELVANKFVVSDGIRNIKVFNPGPKKIMITDANGKVSSFDYNESNKLVGVDATGKLVLFPRLPEVVPDGRELIVELIGSSNPSAILNTKTITLPGVAWYEIEILGAGGGGGGGIGKPISDASFLNGKAGGAGGYYKGQFSLGGAANAVISVGNGGGGGGGINWVLLQPGLTPIGTNFGGAGGRTPLLFVTTGNDGEDASYAVAGEVDNYKAGGTGINSGAVGGLSFLGLVGAPGLNGELKGSGGGGGGANGPYGGDGGDSVYIDNSGVIGCYSGGGGGAGGGTGIGGDGGNASGIAPISYGGGAGGDGAIKDPLDYTKSAGGGGGGGASIFKCGDILITCGGGGGGAGAGYGGSKNSEAGFPGTNSRTIIEGGGAPGGIKGKGCNTELGPVNCQGSNGSPGIIRIWRCI